MTVPFASRLRAGLSGLVMLRGAALVLTTIASIIVARHIGPNDFGQLAFVLALASVLAIPSNSAAVPFLVRFTAAYNRPADYGSMVSAWRWSARRTRLWVLVGMVAALAVSAAVALTAGAGPALPYVVAALLIALWSQAARIAGILQGLKRVVLAQLFDWLVQPALYLLLVLGLLLSGALALNAVLVAFGVALAVSVVAGSVTSNSVRSVFKQQASSTSAEHLPDPSWPSAWRFYSLIQAVSVANLRFPLLIIGFVSVNEQAGFYRAAESIALLPPIMITVANSVLGPYVSELFHNGKHDELQSLMRRVSRYATCIALLFVVGVVAFGELLLVTLYGPSFSDAYLPLCILSVGQLVNVACGSVGLLANMTGDERYAFKAQAAGLVVSVTLCLVLAPEFGALGASVAAACSTVLWTVVVLFRSAQKIGVNPSVFALRVNRMDRVNQ